MKTAAKKPPMWLRAAFVVLFSAVLLVVAEVGLRFFGPNLETIRHLVDLRVAPYGLKPDTRISFSGLHAPLPKPVTWAVNSQGIRADHPIAADSSRFRIATYGDSEAFGWGVELAESFQGRMEAIDGEVEVINFGVPGYNAANIADHIERTAPGFHPDLIIYLVHKNDFDDPFEVGDAVVGSSLVRLARFAYYRVFKQPREKRLRDSPERIARFVAQIERIARFSERNDIPLVLAFLKWENRAVLPPGSPPGIAGAAGRQQNWGLPRDLNVDAVIHDEPKIDSHLSPIAHEKLARYLCATISGRPQARCVPPRWQAPGVAPPLP